MDRAMVDRAVYLVLAAVAMIGLYAAWSVRLISPLVSAIGIVVALAAVAAVVLYARRKPRPAGEPK